MKIKFLSFIFLLAVGLNSLANMASPVQEGTKSGTALSSKDISILSEQIYIKIDAAFKTAKYIVEYTIQSDFSGTQIPLLFYAQDFRDSFSVWLDNTGIPIRDVPVSHYGSSPFRAFSGSLGKSDNGDEILIYWQKNSGIVHKLSDLKYFEAPIEKGVHHIRVEYTANVWTDHSGWINRYSFRYSLSPAKYWKSFGSLKVRVEQQANTRQLTTNLGLPEEKEIKPVNSWTFNTLPGEFIDISFSPAPPKMAAVLMAVEPTGIAVFLASVLAIFHFGAAMAYRRKNVNKKFSAPLIAGCFLVPLLALIAYNYSYTIIDNLLGNDAGRYHGYTFLSFLLYPFILALYWVIFLVVDKLYKGKLKRDNTVG